MKTEEAVTAPTHPTRGSASAHLRLSSVLCHPRSDWRYSLPVNREQLLDLTERVKLVAGVEPPSSSARSTSTASPLTSPISSNGPSSVTSYSWPPARQPSAPSSSRSASPAASRRRTAITPTPSASQRSCCLRGGRSGGPRVGGDGDSHHPRRTGGRHASERRLIPAARKAGG
jgi:hypothetical protein